MWNHAEPASRAFFYVTCFRGPSLLYLLIVLRVGQCVCKKLQPLGGQKTTAELVLSFYTLVFRLAWHTIYPIQNLLLFLRQHLTMYLWLVSNS